MLVNVKCTQMATFQVSAGVQIQCKWQLYKPESKVNPRKLSFPKDYLTNVATLGYFGDKLFLPSHVCLGQNKKGRMVSSMVPHRPQQ